MVAVYYRGQRVGTRRISLTNGRSFTPSPGVNPRVAFLVNALRNSRLTTDGRRRLQLALYAAVNPQNAGSVAPLRRLLAFRPRRPRPFVRRRRFRPY